MFNPKLYEENNHLQNKFSQIALDTYGKNIKWKERNNRIIDIGCGDGTVNTMLKKFLPRDFTMLGCDINESMVKLANDKYRDEQTSFTVLDIIGDLPKELKANFSHVFSFFTLHWIIEQERAFRNIFDLLEQDGECFLVFVGNFSTFDVYRSLALNNKWSTWVNNVEKYVSPYHDSKDPKKEIINLMANTGFDGIQVHCDMVFNIFDDIEALKGFLRAINPFKIPEDMYDDLWEDHLELWKQFEGLQEHAPKDIKLNLKLISVHARKPSENKEYNDDCIE